MNQGNNHINIMTECPYVGIHVSMVETSKVLKKIGYDLTFLLPQNERNRYGEAQVENENTLKEFGEIKRIPLRRKLRYAISDAISLKKYLGEDNKSPIISYTNYAGKIARLFKVLGGKNEVYHCHNCIQTKRFKGLEGKIDHFLENLLSKYCDYYIAVSASEAFLLNREYKIDPKKILFTPNFRSIDVSIRDLNNKSHYTYIYIGRLVRDKGTHILLESLELLGMLDEIIIVGEGPERIRLEQRFPTVKFTGRVENHEVLDLMSESRFLLSASVMEGLSYSLIEGMKSGLVPIVSNVEGHNDLIIEGYNGFLFETQDELTNLMFKTKLISEGKVDSMSNNAIQTAEKLTELGINQLEKHFRI